MSKLTYKIIYNPNNEELEAAISKDINFLCADNKLHIRLRDYDHEEVIHGFVDKLTYIVTYLFQRNVQTGKLTNNILENFVNSDYAVKDLNMWLTSVFSTEGKTFKGLKISRNYRKISNYSLLGSFSEGACPLKDGMTYGDLQFFAESLRFVPLEEFILNDAIDLVITKSTVKNSYTKFVNKAKKSKKEKLEYIPLF